MLILGADDLRKALDMRGAMDAVCSAYASFSEGHAEVPLRTSFDVKDRGTTLFMPGYLKESEQIGVKIVSVFPRNHALGLPTTTAVMALVDTETGLVSAMMDGSYLTAFRTGAASGVATECLSRPDSETLAIIGTGTQARTQVKAICTARRIRRVISYDISRTRLEGFVDDMRPDLEVVGASVEMAATADDAVSRADIVATATTSRTPVFHGGCIRPGTHVNGIGSYMRTMRELDEVLLARASKIVVDSRDAALAEAGDITIPMDAGLISREAISSEIGEVIRGAKPGRESDTEITVFKAVGVAVLDVAVAFAFLAQARQRGLGAKIDLQVKAQQTVVS